MSKIKEESDLYILNPNLIWNDDGERLSLVLPYFGNKIVAEPQLKRILNLFTEPLSLSETKAKQVDQKIIDFLIYYFLILPLESCEFLSGGLLEKVNNPIGYSASIQFLNQTSSRYNCFFGVPVDSTHGFYNSPKLGPQSVRKHLFSFLSKTPSVNAQSFMRVSDELKDSSLSSCIELQITHLCDLGDVIHHPQSEGISIVGQRIKWIILALLKLGHRPIMIGGDHSISFYAIQGLLESNEHIGIIHFDAHSDMKVGAYECFEPLTNANVFRKLIQDNRIKTLLQIGLRDCSQTISSPYSSIEKRVKQLSSEEIHNLEPKEVFSSLPTDIPYYLTFDVDVIDPSLAKEVASPIPGGLTYCQAQALVHYAIGHFQIIAADFVEVCGTHESYNSAAEITSKLICDLLWNENFNSLI